MLILMLVRSLPQPDVGCGNDVGLDGDGDGDGDGDDGDGDVGDDNDGDHRA